MKPKKGGVARPQLKQEYCSFQLEVRPSAIHRWGVFALEAIPKGRKVMEYTGELVSRKEGKKRAESNEIHCLFTIDAYWYVDGAVGGSGAEFVNHCCEPNLESRIVKRHVLYFSLRDIQKGEELLLDYHFGKNQEKVVCKCGAKGCRGFINVVE
ncbi:MAG: SET domain-containing protein-lysine N-methyltransferase [Bryobacter sp.]|jgi:SET domain-containing protein|nr:SET domain-containing protein-lysine N-methyltransferase [Bryobacter sp. CoA8 C33]